MILRTITLLNALEVLSLLPSVMHALEIKADGLQMLPHTDSRTGLLGGAGCHCPVIIKPKWGADGCHVLLSSSFRVFKAGWHVGLPPSG